VTVPSLSQQAATWRRIQVLKSSMNENQHNVLIHHQYKILPPLLARNPPREHGGELVTHCYEHFLFRAFSVLVHLGRKGESKDLKLTPFPS